MIDEWQVEELGFDEIKPERLRLKMSNGNFSFFDN